jgi:hypothetical protein
LWTELWNWVGDTTRAGPARASRIEPTTVPSPFELANTLASRPTSTPAVATDASAAAMASLIAAVVRRRSAGGSDCGGGGTSGAAT